MTEAWSRHRQSNKQESCFPGGSPLPNPVKKIAVQVEIAGKIVLVSTVAKIVPYCRTDYCLLYIAGLRYCSVNQSLMLYCVYRIVSLIHTYVCRWRVKTAQISGVISVMIRRRSGKYRNSVAPEMLSVRQVSIHRCKVPALDGTVFFAGAQSYLCGTLKPKLHTYHSSGKHPTTSECKTKTTLQRVWSTRSQSQSTYRIHVKDLLLVGLGSHHPQPYPQKKTTPPPRGLSRVLTLAGSRCGTCFTVPCHRSLRTPYLIIEGHLRCHGDTVSCNLL